MTLFSMSLMMRTLSIDLCMRLYHLGPGANVFNNILGVLWAGIHHK
jgi:hypothetical protein